MTAGTSPGEPKATRRAFTDSDVTGLWMESSYSSNDYVEPYPDDELILSVEAELGGYKLPASYIELARIHNGGTLQRTTIISPKKSAAWLS